MSAAVIHTSSSFGALLISVGLLPQKLHPRHAPRRHGVAPRRGIDANRFRRCRHVGGCLSWRRKSRIGKFVCTHRPGILHLTGLEADTSITSVDSHRLKLRASVASALHQGGPSVYTILYIYIYIYIYMTWGVRMERVVSVEIELRCRSPGRRTLYRVDSSA